MCRFDLVSHTLSGHYSIFESILQHLCEQAINKIRKELYIILVAVFELSQYVNMICARLTQINICVEFVTFWLIGTIKLGNSRETQKINIVFIFKLAVNIDGWEHWMHQHIHVPFYLLNHYIKHSVGLFWMFRLKTCDKVNCFHNRNNCMYCLLLTDRSKSK